MLNCWVTPPSVFVDDVSTNSCLVSGAVEPQNHPASTPDNFCFKRQAACIFHDCEPLIAVYQGSYCMVLPLATLGRQWGYQFSGRNVSVAVVTGRTITTRVNWFDCIYSPDVP